MADPGGGTTELLHKAIKCIQELRSGVANVFDQLSNGMKDAQNPEGKEKAFLAELQQKLTMVVCDYGELEKIGNTIQASGGPPSLGNTAVLTLDPLLDKTPIYSKLLQTHKWSHKVHEYATQAHQLLHANPLKRTHMSGMMLSKRQRRITTTSHSYPPQLVDNVVQSYGRIMPNMNIVLTRPFGDPAVLQVTLGRTMKAVLVLRGLQIEWVTVVGFDEECNSDTGKATVWTKSKYAVFQKVTDHASAAMLHFQSPVGPDLSLKAFMMWLNGYNSLFSAPCHKCGRYLRDHLPPTWRDYRHMEPYHEGCKP